ncbi:Beta-glucanase [Neolecta irregularis DAH-3]|uniref:Beta-glucanase n=1 Tax=Neolecta irregularis (strain DAH-3) TaxID=1198029 RepID=A0A1U7LL91_NEOID|nr:Beta-glucanase [Neolecta irregularis DAH-3]|eukprot:OLL23425.1 Beta-glucanase [Neolecta irregularis DAH-3]
MLLIFIVFSLASQLSQAICECGYKTANGLLWTHTLNSDFTAPSMTNVTYSSFSSQWTISNWSNGNVAAGNRTVTIGRQFLPQNVYFQNKSLNLKVSAYTGRGKILCGEISTVRADILYGSFRSTFKVQPVSGACAGFFYYYVWINNNPELIGQNDTQEIDVEILTKDPTTRAVHYTQQPIVRGSQFTNVLPNPWTNFVRYRFDWLPKSSTFFADGQRERTIRVNTEHTPGTVKLNMWSNGNTLWSAGPPTQDAIMSVQNTCFFFNVSEDLKNLPTSEFNTACSAHRVPVCKVLD